MRLTRTNLAGHRHCLANCLLWGGLIASAGCWSSAESKRKDKTDVSNQDTPVVTSGTKEPPSPIRISELPAARRIDFTYRNGSEAGRSSILETLGGGVAAFDFDGDQFVDLCFPGGGRFSGDKSLSGHPTGFFRNLGSLSFSSVANLARIEKATWYSHGASVGDFNSDGFPDLLITGYGGVLLWRNQGDGTFQEISQSAGLVSSRWSTGAAWGDLNGDGTLDLYLEHYVDWSFAKDPFCAGPKPGERDVCSPRDFSGQPDKLFVGNGDGTFRDGSAEARLRTDATSKGLGVLLADVDNDGDLDIYVANDTTDNYLYLNESRGKFSEEGLSRGVAMDDTGVPNGSMGVDLCDYNNDGWPDIWVANYEHESFALYRNEGRGDFVHVSQLTRITSLGNLFVGFGTACADLDHDGDEDILVANGHALKFPTRAPRKQLPLALENDEGKFRRLKFGPENYFSTPHEGRGLALADLDNDGDLDPIVSHVNAPVAVLINETPVSGHWLAVRLVGTRSHRDAVGARLVLHTSTGDQMRQIKGGASYLSHNDRRVFWGIPRDTSIQRLTVYWPSGHVQQLDHVQPNRELTIVEDLP